MIYTDFLKKKVIEDKPSGFEPPDLNENLFHFQSDIVRWALRRGRAAIFADCGLGKTLMQLEWANQVAIKTGGKVLILAPLAVAEQTVNEGKRFGIEAKHCHDQSEVEPGITVTNYQKLHRFDPSEFVAVVLDESSILKSFDGATRTTIIESFRETPYRLACTATPAPNDFMELGNHCEFLGVMSRVEMLSMFFFHDGGDTSKWRLKGHAEDEFWRWVCSWAVNIRKPSDLGYPDEDFILPKLIMHEHVVQQLNGRQPGFLFAMPASTLQERREARKESIEDRVKLAADLVNASNDQWLIWCNLNSESEALTKAINGAVEVTGSDSDESKQQSMSDFIKGSAKRVVTKSMICGFGMNFQHCHKMLFVGLTDSYEQFYQAVRRCWRFGQKNEVDAHIVISSTEGAVLSNIKRKEQDSQKMIDEMMRHMLTTIRKNVRGSEKTTVHYNPTKEMVLPKFLK